nr:flagellar basal body-associated FliL family protein [Hyphomonas sp. Mor2]
MKLIVTSLVAIIFVAAGSFAAVVLKTPSEATAVQSDKGGDEYADGDHGDDHDKSDKKTAKKDDGYGKKPSSGNTAYYKFSREFVVPIMRGGQVNSLIILHISLETDSSTSERLFSEEPKLRDNIMTTLIALSNDGRTLEEPTNINNYETIRSMILMNLKDSIDDGIENVLIVDMAKQNL